MPPFPSWWPLPSDDPLTPALWDELKSALNAQQSKPMRAQEVTAREMVDKSGHYYLLKNGKFHSYLRLSPEEFWVWEKIDGETTVQQLVFAYFMQYKAFAFGAILSLLDRLHEGSMLSEPPKHIYAEVSSAIQNQSWLYKLSWMARLAFTKEFAIKNLDKRLESIHRSGGWILFTWPVQALFFMVSAVGLILFVLLIRDQQYHLLTLDKAVQLGLIAYIPLVIHEFGHAITAKHVGCEVYRGGVMLYYGMPAAFVDTTDVWMFKKGDRLAVTWAGPYTGYIIGGACAILVYSTPWLSLPAQVFLLQVALASIFSTTLNILPLLKLDGYYLLADALEIPRLRERSMDFVTRHLVAKVGKREKWDHEEIIFLVFGILAILSTFYFIYMSLAFWDHQATKSISALLSTRGDLRTLLISSGMVLLVVSSSIYLILLLLGNARPAFLWMQRIGLLSTRWRAAALLFVLALTLAYLPKFLLPTLSPWLMILTGFMVFSFLAWLAFSNFLSMGGSIHAWMWIPVSAASLVGIVHFIGELDVSWAGTIPTREAALLLFVLSFILTGRLVLGLQKSWRSVSLGFSLAGILTLFWARNPELWALSGLLVSAGLLHWRMRPPEQKKTGVSEVSPSTRANLVTAYQEIRKSILSELELDFGRQTRKWVEEGLYKSHKSSVGKIEFPESITGMSPDDYGGPIALSLEELLVGVARAAGDRYAWRVLAYGYDSLDWELKEIAEDFVLKYVPHARGLSNELAAIRDDLGILLRSVPLFINLSAGDMAKLSKRFTTCRYAQGKSIVKAGEVGDAFYIIRAGRAEVISPGGLKLNELGRGDYFGEASLLTNKKRNATVRAITPLEVLELSKYHFDQLLRTNVSFDEKARQEFKRLRILRQVPLFEEFEGKDLKLLSARLEEKCAGAGEVIFHQGEPGDLFYIIESGMVSIQIDGQERAVLGTGEYFGEIALLMDVPRTATVIALQPTTLLELRACDFNVLIQEFRAMKLVLERTSSRRTLANKRWRQENILVPAGSPPISTFTPGNNT
jgi:putative peptide zinc metalloprotease protein